MNHTTYGLCFKGTVGPLKRAIFSALFDAYAKEENIVLDYIQVSTWNSGVYVSMNDFKLFKVLPTMVFDRLPQYDDREILKHFSVNKL